VTVADEHRMTDAARALFRRLVLQRAWTAFAVLGISFLGFGVSTVSLAMVLKANLDLIAAHGWPALADGAAVQLLELAASGFVAMGFYVVFKACEHRLVQGLTDLHRQPPAAKREQA
jgi:ABC-type dipeptide/oligopeptide/nickel transport system permease subunit